MVKKFTFLYRTFLEMAWIKFILLDLSNCGCVHLKQTKIIYNGIDNQYHLDYYAFEFTLVHICINPKWKE